MAGIRMNPLSLAFVSCFAVIVIVGVPALVWAAWKDLGEK